jgi:Carboxypeptidase regulatory-like domain
MATSNTIRLTALLLTFAAPVLAQQPPRPVDPARSVTLSLAEYNRLIDLASRPPQGTAGPPVAAVLASANLRVRVERDTARGVFDVNGDVLRPGVSRVSLLSGATLIDANAGGRPLPLVAEGDAHSALVPGPGPFSLTLEWGTPLIVGPGRASFVLPVPQAGSARATIDLPGEQADVHLSAGLVTARSVANGRTVVDVTLDPGSATEVSWSMRDSAPVAAAREVRALVNVMTLITLGDSDVRMVALINVSVVQGELHTLGVRLPAGYELTGISGSSLIGSEPREDGVVLTLGDPALRSHQLLVSLERSHHGGSFALDTGLVTVRDVQREVGEVAVEGVGTMELTASERDGMHRIDVRELNSALQSLSRLPVLAAFRYQRSTAAPGLALDVKRFADAGVLAAVADRAVATTLVTSEGRALTEVSLELQNRAQPFLKVTLPPGASMISVDVAGEAAKPVLGADGIRVPLLRLGFRPSGTYQVSFVFLHAGTPFARKGELEMTLPRIDIPVGILEWEVFAPEQYSVRAVGGNVIDVQKLGGATPFGRLKRAYGSGARFDGATLHGPVRISFANDGLPGQIRGHATDSTGAVLPGVTIELRTAVGPKSAVTGSDGTYSISNVASGEVIASAALAGFQPATTSFLFDQRPRRVEFEMQLGSLQETVTVSAESPIAGRAAPPQNVINLQRRTAGVLPIRVDVPRAGTSHQFVKPLVVDQETVVKLRYKQRS